MSVNREVGQTDDLRLLGLLTGGGSGGYMYNYGPSGAPSNQPPTPFEQGLTRGPVSMTGMSDAQIQSLIDQRLDARAFDMNEGIDAPDQRGEPTELGEVENIFEILSQIMTGTQGTIGGLDPETVAAIRSGIDPSADVEELETIAQQILEAGGYLEWLEQQDLEGPPEELPTELEEEIDIGSDTVDTDVDVDPDMPIYIPFPDLPSPVEEGDEGDEGEGENGEGTGDEGEGTDTGRGQDRGDGEEPPRGGGRGGGSVGYDPVGQSEQDPFRVVFGPIAAGSSGEGVGGGGGVASTGMLTPRFNPYMASIGYTPVAIPKPILPQAPIVSSLFSEFLS